MIDRTIRERLPAIPDDKLTPAQKKAVKGLLSGSRRSVRGAFVPMLRSPNLLEKAQRLEQYLRYRSVIPRKLRELAILATARHWQQGYEWHEHARLATTVGLSDLVVDTLALDWDGAGLPSDERTVLQFCRELHRSHAVSDSVYKQAKLLLGEDGVVELCGICGYYTLLAMLMNVARTPAADGASVPFSNPEAKSA
jgi:4-carboxymuconolactone decarboxylase